MMDGSRLCGCMSINGDEAVLNSAVVESRHTLYGRYYEWHNSAMDAGGLLAQQYLPH